MNASQQLWIRVGIDGWSLALLDITYNFDYSVARVRDEYTLLGYISYMATEILCFTDVI